MAWSKFSTKLTEVIDRILGDRSRPAQILREAAAQGDARRLIAAGERDAELIRRGELQVEFRPELSQVPVSSPSSRQPEFARQVAARIVHQELRREENLEKIVYYASQEEDDGDFEKEDDDFDEEWFTQFFNDAQDVSTEQLQRLWARLLSGEIKKPGVHSIETIDFLRRMNSSRAKQIERIGPYVFGQGAIIKCELLEKQEWSDFVFWLHLENLGILNGATGSGLELKAKSTIKSQFVQNYVYGNTLLICRHADANKTLRIPAYKLTPMGLEILSLGKFDPDYQYLVSVAQKIMAGTFNVSIADIVSINKSGVIDVRNERAIV